MFVPSKTGRPCHGGSREGGPPMQARALEISKDLPRSVLKILLWPLEMAYLYGPSVAGMWEGASSPEICASLTSVPSEHWSKHSEECQARIELRFWSWIWLALGGAYCVAGLALLIRATQWGLSKRDDAAPRAQHLYLVGECPSVPLLRDHCSPFPSARYVPRVAGRYLGKKGAVSRGHGNDPGREGDHAMH